VNPIDAVLSRLPDARKTAADRWRAACPNCGESNCSTLSIGVGDSGAVLLKCFKSGCGPDVIAAALGLELTDLFPSRESWAPPLARRRMLSDRQALDLLHGEAQLVGLCAANIGHGVALTDADRARVLRAAGRIAHLRDEART